MKKNEQRYRLFGSGGKVDSRLTKALGSVDIALISHVDDIFQKKQGMHRLQLMQEKAFIPTQLPGPVIRALAAVVMNDDAVFDICTRAVPGSDLVDFLSAWLSRPVDEAGDGSPPMVAANVILGYCFSGVGREGISRKLLSVSDLESDAVFNALQSKRLQMCSPLLALLSRKSSLSVMTLAELVNAKEGVKYLSALYDRCRQGCDSLDDIDCSSALSIRQSLEPGSVNRSDCVVM